MTQRLVGGMKELEGWGSEDEGREWKILAKVTLVVETEYQSGA